MKAQFWSLDVIFAIVIFMMTLLILSFAWFNITNQFSISYNYGVAALQLQLQNLEQTIFTTGSPSNWNNLVNVSNTMTWSDIRIGIGTGSGTASISQDKLAAAIAMSNYNYNESKSAFGVGFDYYITITNNATDIEFGHQPAPHSPYAIYSAEVPIQINKIPYKMQIMVWTNSSFGVS